jgi:hypothetical protein
MDSARKASLSAYFGAQGNVHVVEQITDYCKLSDEYNDAVQGAKRVTVTLELLAQRGDVLMAKLKVLGLAG